MDQTANNQTTIEKLFNEYAVDLFNYAQFILVNHADACDVIQELFGKLLANPSLLPDSNNHKSYLIRAVRNHSLDTIRKHNNNKKLSLNENIIFNCDDFDEVLDNQKYKLQEAIATLPPQQREVMFFKIYQGLTFAEIGEYLEISADTAASRYRYGLAKVKKTLLNDETEEMAG